MGRPPFEVCHALHDPVPGIAVDEQVYMVRHDLHLQDGKPMILGDLQEDFLQPGVDPVYKDFSPIFRAEDHMVPA